MRHNYHKFDISDDKEAVITTEDYIQDKVKLVVSTVGFTLEVVMCKDLADKCAFQLSSWLQDSDERSNKKLT